MASRRAAATRRGRPVAVTLGKAWIAETGKSKGVARRALCQGGQSRTAHLEFADVPDLVGKELRARDLMVELQPMTERHFDQTCAWLADSPELRAQIDSLGVPSPD